VCLRALGIAINIVTCIASGEGVEGIGDVPRADKEGSALFCDPSGTVEEWREKGFNRDKRPGRRGEDESISVEVLDAGNDGRVSAGGMRAFAETGYTVSVC
jgi:hypothetical protein